MPDYVQVAKDAIEFRESPRGRFIMAQALYYGIKKLTEVEGIMREVSNICDMQYLLDTLYPGYEDAFHLIDEHHIAITNGTVSTFGSVTK